MAARFGGRLSARGLGLLAVLALFAAMAVPTRSVAAVAQDAGEPVSGDIGQVRIVHASPDAGAIDIYIDEQVVLPGLDSLTATEFFPLAVGDHQVQFVPTGGAIDGALAEVEVEVEEGKSYEVVALNQLADIESKVFEINQERIESANTARVRVIHAVPDNDGIDLATATGETLVEGVEFSDGTDYQDIAAGVYDLEVRPAGENQSLVSAPGVEMQAGMVYDLFFVGLEGNQTMALLPLSAAAEVACTAALGIGTTADACLRIVHASPDAPNVDAYLDDSAEPVVRNLSSGTATDFVPVPAGEHQVRLVSTGGSIDTAVIDEEYEFEAGRAYQVAALNVSDDLEARSYEVDLGPLGENQARVRVVHASPDAGEVDVAVAGGPPLFEEAGFPDATSYVSLAAGTYDLELRTPGETEVILAVPGLELQPGMVYDIFAIGQAEQGTLALLPLTAPTASSEAAATQATPAAPTPAPVATSANTPVSATPTP